MNEAQLMDKIVGLAHTLGWRAAHFRPAMTKHGYRTACQYDAKGWPDLFLVHPASGDVLAREVKIWARRNAGDTADQDKWGDWMTRCGIDWGVWTERDEDEWVARLVRPTKARVA